MYLLLVTSIIRDCATHCEKMVSRVASFGEKGLCLGMYVCMYRNQKLFYFRVITYFYIFLLLELLFEY